MFGEGDQAYVRFYVTDNYRNRSCHLYYMGPL